MRSYTQKPKASQEIKSKQPTGLRSGHTRAARSVLHSHRPSGNRAVQRLLQANTAKLESGPTVKTSNGLARALTGQVAAPQVKQLMKFQGQKEEELKAQAESTELKKEEDEETVLQGKATGGKALAQPGTSAAVAAESGAGGMPYKLKSGLEALSGLELSGVQVHYNSPKPAQLNASAYTEGQQIHVGPGEEAHLAHEGWHVVQQMQGRVKPTIQAHSMAINDDVGLEREADQMGAKAASHDAARETGTSTQAPGHTQTDGVTQRKLKITGLDDAKRKAFVNKMNDGSEMKFELDASGFVQQMYLVQIPTNEYSTQMVAAITDAQTVILNLVDQDDTVFGDSFASGKVDYVDMVGMSSELFRSNLMHFVVERFAIPDYELKKATATQPEFLAAHTKGQEAQERQLKEWYPKKTIKYKDQGYDAASKVVDKAGNGSIDYYFDFTDVKQVFKQKIVAGAVKESIISSKIVIVK